MGASKIRNFVVISHVDHGKSTLADRFLEITGTVDKRLLQPQHLDRLESERERGITIKMAPVRMRWHPEFSISIRRLADQFSNKEYILNLIDTPGHNDFKYEVSRALAAVEGALLLVDASQGIQAQTRANLEAARKAGLTIIGAVTKVDLQPPPLASVINDLAELLDAKPEEILQVSGKTGSGVPELLAAVVEKIPPPSSSLADVSRALIFDSLYDDHKGIIAFVRVVEGEFRADGKIKEVGYFTPELRGCEKLMPGEIGWIATGSKDVNEIKIGGTIGQPPLPGFQEPQPVVFVSFHPENPDQYDDLKKALTRLRLNDASLTFVPESSQVLGRGLKVGFLGKLHFEITAERLAQEFKIQTVHSFPSVAYKFDADGQPTEEPVTKIEILTPPQYLGNVLALKELFRLSRIETKTLGPRLIINAQLPLADLISNFDDQLKSVSQGYASFSYETIGYQTSALEKLGILVNGHLLPGLTRVLPQERIQREARQTVERLKKLLPRQPYVQAIQAAVRGRIIARETIPALRKDVTGYLYGGDRTRKMKLWKKQRRGKARLKELSQKAELRLPAAIFKELLKR